MVFGGFCTAAITYCPLKLVIFCIVCNRVAVGFSPDFLVNYRHLNYGYSYATYFYEFNSMLLASVT